MPAVIVIGSQWGDEGKGKLIDVFSSQVDFVVRYQGGANAGHTLKVKNEEIVVHLVPSAVFHPKVKCIIASGVALDIESLCEEIQNLKKLGKLQEKEQLLISDTATLVLDYHKKLDQAREEQLGQTKIGTTGKGIGPAYECRATRKALIFSDLFSEDAVLLKKLTNQMEEINFLLVQFYNQEAVSVKETFQKLKKFGENLKAYRCRDVSLVLYEALKEEKKILFEGAQGCLLDLYHGTYPYVTSSSTLASGALTGSGVGFGQIKKTMGITKAYTTRVGEGPFPTENKEASGKYLQEKGHEFGATTGRKRRCGWLDMLALSYAVRLNGLTSLALMKLDVLSGLKEIKVCIGYELEGKKIQNFPILSSDLEKVKPIYKTFAGWDQDLSQLKDQKDFPKEALYYIQFISKTLNLPIDVISVGPSRVQTIWLNPLF